MLSIDEWTRSGEYFLWRGHRIFLRCAGRGEDLLLIHGFPTSSADWHAITGALQSRYRVLTFDLLGFGLSDKPTTFDYRIAAQADLAEAVLAHFGVARCRILAHDYGNTVAQELLARQNTETGAWQLQQLCFLNGGLFPETHRPRLIQRLLASPLGGLIARLTSYQRFAREMNRICAVPLPASELERMWQLLTHNHGVSVLPKLIRYMAERREHRSRWVGGLLDARVPLRLIDGVDDPISGSHLVQRYRELVPTPDVVELASVGHYPQLEASERVLEALFEFFARPPD